MILTATSIVHWNEMFETLRVQAAVGPSPHYQRGFPTRMADKKFYNLWMTVARLPRQDDVGISFPDIALSSQGRRTGNDIDYARAYFPALTLTWKTGLSREEAMKMVYESQREHATRLVLQHESPRAVIFPGWAPSYSKGLEGPVLAPIPYESRGIRRSWYTTEVERQIPTDKPQGLLLALISSTGQSPLCGCQVSEGESQATMDGISKAIGTGCAYLLSDVPLHPIGDWAKNAMLVERVELDHDDEAFVILTVAVTVIQENATSWENKWLIILENPISEHYLSGKFISQVRINLGQDRSHGKHRLINAAYDGEQATVESLISDRSEVSSRDEKGWTGLHATASSGSLNVAKILLENHLNAIRTSPLFDPNATDNIGRTPLYLAAENGHDDMVDLLINSGADPNYRHKESLMSIIDQPIKYDHPSTLHLLLLKGADPKIPNGLGLTPLVFANNHPNMLRILLSTALIRFM